MAEPKCGFVLVSQKDLACQLPKRACYACATRPITLEWIEIVSIGKYVRIWLRFQLASKALRLIGTNLMHGQIATLLSRAGVRLTKTRLRPRILSAASAPCGKDG